MDVYLGLDGQSAVVVPRARLETRAGEVSKSVTRRLPDLDALTRTLCDGLPGARGVLTVQAFYDDRVTPKVIRFIEVNARFGGGFPLTLAAGGDFPRWLVDELNGKRDAIHEPWESDLLMLRFDDALFQKNWPLQVRSGR